MENQDSPNPDQLANEQNASNYQTIAEELSAAKTLLSNTLNNPAILERMGSAGYAQTTIEQQIAKLDEVTNLNNRQLQEYGEQYNATDAWHHARAGMHPAYIRHLSLARIEFKGNRGAAKALGLNDTRKRGQADYASQAVTFYTNILATPDYATTMVGTGVGTDMINDAIHSFNTLQNLKNEQQRESGEAQQATKVRDAAFDATMEFVDKYRAKAKIILSDVPQLMEELGIQEAS